MRNWLAATALFVLGLCLAGCSSIPGRMPPYLPLTEELENLVIQEGPRYFSAADLEQLIDREAEFFFSYGCRGAQAAEYVPAGSPNRKIYAYVFDMGAPMNAFGIYSSFTAPEGEFYKLGVEGCFLDGSLFFYKDRFFGEVSSDVRSAEMAELIKDLGAEIAGNIKGAAEAPARLNMLPSEGLLAHSVKYIPEGVLGYSPLRNGIMGQYVIEGQEATGFICSYWEWLSAGDALSKLLKEVEGRSFESKKMKGKLYETKLENGGLLIFCKKGRHIIGVKNVEKREDSLGLLRKMSRKL